MTVRAGERGQATVELALALPVVVVLLLLVLQVGLVARDQLLVAHAAREAARAAAVDARPGAATTAARHSGPLDPGRLTVATSGRDGPGSVVVVDVDYRAPTDVPLVGPLVRDVDLHARVAMRVER
ncbi:MAG TPA: TadE/TadG family type IV pilus assembly protein [Acidimicrobiales bacterium]